MISSVIIAVMTLGLMGSDALDLLAQTFGIVPHDVTEVLPAPEPSDETPADGLRLRDLDIHPDVMHSEYLLAATDTAQALVPLDIAQSFQSLLSMYEFRQAIDDNFTARAYDIESGDVLAVSALDEDRQQFTASGKADWRTIDRKRRDLTK
ncbi:MAG: hypothetical protein R3178_10160, partial [Rhodothermales bacterium]|nr:hypothetical protein [Rhodothermales bacterium]